jgi:hypothetical protein
VACRGTKLAGRGSARGDLPEQRARRQGGDRRGWLGQGRPVGVACGSMPEMVRWVVEGIGKFRSGCRIVILQPVVEGAYKRALMF